jgi:histidinol-phosphate aminotransferase
LLRREDILELCTAWHGIVVVDEAYVEFADMGSSLADAVQQHLNLIVLRTFSKARGLAGIRLGYAIANPLIVSYLLSVKAPYNLNAVTLALALRAVRDEQFVGQACLAVSRERTRLQHELSRFPFVRRVFPSSANFLLVEFHDAGMVYNSLLEQGIIVRRRYEERLRNCLRLTVGTESENSRVLSALEGIQ